MRLNKCCFRRDHLHKITGLQHKRTGLDVMFDLPSRQKRRSKRAARIVVAALDDGGCSEAPSHTDSELSRVPVIHCASRVPRDISQVCEVLSISLKLPGPS